MNSENQIWSLIWSSLQEASYREGKGRKYPLGGRDKETLFEVPEQGSFCFILVAVAFVVDTKYTVNNLRDLNKVSSGGLFFL